MIELSHAGLRYNGGPEILTDVSLSIKEGDFTFLTGASGSGKTTLMRLLSIGLLPTRGDICIFGKDILQLSKSERAELRRHIGLIYQDFRLLNHLSLFDNIALPLRLMDMSEKKIKPAVENIAEWIGLKDYLKMKPPFLSGGQQQRVAIARAVITKPKFLIADEPTGSLDEQMGHRIMALFEELNNTGTAIILATHDRALMKRFNHHPVLQIKAGHLI